MKKGLCVLCGVIDCGHHCCCTVWGQQVQMSIWVCSIWLRFAPGWDDTVAEELPICHSLSNRGWKGFSRMALILSFILLSVTDSSCPVPAWPQSWPSSPACLVCWPQQHWCHHTSTPQQRTVHWLLQTNRRSSGACCTHWRIWDVSGRTVCSVPSWRGHQCYEISPVYRWCGPQVLVWVRPLQLPLSGWELGQGAFSSSGSQQPALWSCWYWASGDCCCTTWWSPLYSSLLSLLNQWRSHRKI